MIPKYTALISRENPQLFYCPCDGGSRPKAIDPYGYHLVGCKIGANAIRLHDEVVAMVAKLFRTLRVDAIVEPRCISMAIAKTASRNVAFKVAKMRDSIMEDQDELMIRKSECEELGLEANTKAVLEDVGHNADLYIANQEDIP